MNQHTDCVDNKTWNDEVAEESGFWKCFQQRKRKWDRCIATIGEYFKRAKRAVFQRTNWFNKQNNQKYKLYANKKIVLFWVIWWLLFVGLASYSTHTCFNSFVSNLSYEPAQNCNNFAFRTKWAYRAILNGSSQRTRMHSFNKALIRKYDFFRWTRSMYSPKMVFRDLYIIQFQRRKKRGLKGTPGNPK